MTNGYPTTEMDRSDKAMANSSNKWASVRIFRERSNTVMNELFPTVAIKAANKFTKKNQ